MSATHSLGGERHPDDGTSHEPNESGARRDRARRRVRQAHTCKGLRRGVSLLGKRSFVGARTMSLVGYYRLDRARPVMRDVGRLPCRSGEQREKWSDAMPILNHLFLVGEFPV